MGRAAQLLAVLCAVTLVATLAVAGGKKPPGGDDPSTGGGTIYFRFADQVWSMNSDGSDKTPLPVSPGAMAEPSRQLHDGHRWFLTLQEVGTYGTGEYGGPWPHRELFAVRDDGLALQLTFDANLEELAMPVTGFVSYSRDPDRLRWTRDDSRVSWTARRWDVPDLVDGTVLEAGIYSLEIEWVSGTPVPVGDPDILVSTGAAHTHCWFGPTPCVHGHDWSPDGTMVAYGRCVDPGVEVLVPVVSVLDLTDPDVMWDVADGEDPEWSPDGASIAFSRLLTSSRGVEVVSVDGTDRTIVFENVTSPQGFVVDSHYRPSWSPTASHLACSRQTFNTTTGVNCSDVLRAEADGSREANLTGDLDTKKLGLYAVLIAWR